MIARRKGLLNIEIGTEIDFGNIDIGTDIYLGDMDGEIQYIIIFSNVRMGNKRISTL